MYRLPLNIIERTDTRQMSRNEKNSIYQICDELKTIYDGCPEVNTIKHFCVFVRHGRTKGQREIHCFRTKQFRKTVQYSKPSCRNKRISKVAKILHGFRFRYDCGQIYKKW